MGERTLRRLSLCVVATAALFGGFAAFARAETGLAARWALDAQTGAQTPEASGNAALAANLQNGAAIVPGGRFGNALDLPIVGAGGSRGNVTTQPALTPPQFTVMLWVKNVGSPGMFKWVMAKGAQASDGGSFGFSTGGTGEIFFVVRDATTFAVVNVANTSVWDGQWHAVAGTYDGAILRTYLDGVPGAVAAHPTQIAYGLQFTNLNIGNYPGPQVFDYTFPGLIDEVRLYDRALTDAQIAYLQDPAAAMPRSIDEVAPPTIAGVRRIGTISGGKPALFTADATGNISRYEWNLGGDATPEVIGSPGQTSLFFRPPAGTSDVQVRVVGPGGASPYVSQTITTPPATGGGPIVTRLRPQVATLGTVTFTGPPGVIDATSQAALRTACELTRDATVHFQGLEVAGCIRRVTKLEDIPARERGILQAIAGERLLSGGSRRDPATGVRLAIQFDILDGYVSAGPVRVNGVRIEPRPGAAVAIYPAVNVIASSNAVMSVGGINLQTPPNFVLDTGRIAGRIPLGDYAVAPGGSRVLAGFALSGDIKVTLIPGSGVVPGGAEIRTSLSLPEWLRIGGVRAQGNVTVRVVASGELVLDQLRIGPIDGDIGDALTIEGLQLDYVSSADEWRGQGKACVAGGACLDMIPPNGGVTISRGDLKFAGASLAFPPPGIPLFPGVALDRIGFGLGLDPTLIAANAKVTAIKLYEIDGRLILAFPSAAAPYVFDAATAGGGYPAGFYGRVHTRPTVAMAANAALRVPVIGSIPLADGYFLYEFPGYVAFGGGMNQDFFDVLKLTGRVDGEINAENGRFNVLGTVDACVVAICRGATGIVSSTGVGACINVAVVSIGGGVIYSPFEIVLWPLDGCKWSTFRAPNVRGAQLNGIGGPHTVTIRRGDPSRAIRLEGASEAPRVRVTGPGGQTLDSPSVTGLANVGTLRILRSVENKLTVVGLQDPAPGTYTITPMDGAPAATRVTEATDLPDARVMARVGGTGTKRTLTYDVGRRPGQRVTFVEVAPGGEAKTIGVVNGGGKGTIRFISSPGRGRRIVEARFELNNLPAEQRIVARFSAPSGRLAAPRGLRVVRRGGALHVRWNGVAGAQAYEVVATTRGGIQRLRRTTGRAFVVRTPLSAAGTISVRAVAPLVQGRATTVRFGRAASLANRISLLPRGR